jgi:hypothetical protein
MKKAVTVVNAIIILAIVAGIAYALSGGYNIAATEKHWDITFKAIETVRNRSIAAHSEDLEIPLPMDVEGFIIHYHDSCRTCHGAPGMSPAEFVEGLYPKPPTLHKTETQKRWSDGEIVWIIANGIKMTAMPAFGPSHGVSEIHGLAGFVRKLPNMDAAAYRQLATSRGLATETGGHQHGDGGHHGASAESHAETPPDDFLDELERSESGRDATGGEEGHSHDGNEDAHSH